MTQITGEQRQQFQAAAERVEVKLVDFHDRLPADEQLVLEAAFSRLAGGDATGADQGADARGHMIAEERVEPMPEGTGGGGGLKLDHLVKLIGLVWFVGGVLEGPAGLGGPAPEPGQP